MSLALDLEPGTSVEVPLWVGSGGGDVEAFAAWLASTSDRLAFDSETNGLNAFEPGFAVRQIAFGCSDGTSAVVDGSDTVLVREVAEVAFGDPERVWYAHKAVYDLSALRCAYGVEPVCTVNDTLTAARCAWPGRMTYSLKVLRPETERELLALRAHWEEVSGHKLGKTGDKTWLPKAIAGLPADDVHVLRYVATDAVACARLAEHIAGMDKSVGRAVSREVAQDRMWRRTSMAGILVDREGLRAEKARVEAVVAGSVETFGLDLSTNSNAVRQWIAERGIVVKDRDGKDTLSRNFWGKASVPEASRADWEQFKSVRDASTVIGKIKELLHWSAVDGRIHPTIGVNSADQTGRMSIQDPAVQNLTAEVRGYLLADDGKALVGLDLDQVEPRVVAGLSGDPAMREAILSGDVYMAAADLIWPDPPADEDERLLRRKRAKTTLLAQIYGQGSKSLAAQLGLKPEQAKSISSRLLAAWPKLRAWIDHTRTAAEAGEVLTTCTGRALPKCPDFPYKVVNYRVQGSAADVFKHMTRDVHRKLGRFPGSRLWLPVHDELVAECTEADAEDVAVMLGETMRIDLSGIPIGGKPSVLGKRWVHA